MDYQESFKKFTRFSPHSWQSELASSGQSENRLIRIPTGMGKTLGVLNAWLHLRVVKDDQAWQTCVATRYDDTMKTTCLIGFTRVLTERNRRCWNPAFLSKVVHAALAMNVVTDRYPA